MIKVTVTGSDQTAEFRLDREEGWQGEDAHTVELLNTLYPYPPPDRPDNYDPDPVATQEQAAAAFLSGEYTPEASKRLARQIY